MDGCAGSGGGICPQESVALARLLLVILNDSAANCAAHLCGFKNLSLISALRGLTCCKSRINGASAEARKLSAANELLHR